MPDNPTIPWTASSDKIDELWANDGSSDPMIDQVPDMLATLFAQQRQLMLAVWPKEIASGLSTPTAVEEWGMIDNRRVQARIHETFGHLIRELSEAMQHLDGSKSWKWESRAVNNAAFREEIADALHFFLEICIIAGIDGEKLFLEYFRKNIENHNRIAKGY